jgi:protein-disulfide isomerase
MLGRKLGQMIVAVGLGLALAVPMAEAQHNFSPEQKTEVEKIIRDYLLANPELLVEVMEELERRRKETAKLESQRQIEQYRAQIYESEYDVVVNQEGEVPFVEFFDYQCGFCKRALKAVQTIRKARPDVRIIYKEYPILGPISVYAARAALASHRQEKYVEYHDALMAHRGKLDEGMVLRIAEGVGLDIELLQADMGRPEVQQAIKSNLALAERMRIRGTPTFIIGESLSPGAIDYSQMIAQIEEARTNCKVC